jgi:hypothetical protein
MTDYDYDCQHNATSSYVVCVQVTLGGADGCTRTYTDGAPRPITLSTFPPSARSEHGFASVGGRLYVHGGYDGHGEFEWRYFPRWWQARCTKDFSTNMTFN